MEYYGSSETAAVHPEKMQEYYGTFKTHVLPRVVSLRIETW